jgi:hypothetical protein
MSRTITVGLPAVLALALGAGCSCGGGTIIDGGRADARTGSDAGPPVDAAPRPLDSGSLDSGSLDSGTFDSGSLDSGALDAGALDSGVIVLEDGGIADAGAPPLDDAGPLDGGSCCDRLAGAAAIEWRVEDGALPTDSCPDWTLSDTADPEDPLLEGDALVIETTAETENIVYVHGAEVISAAATVVIEVRMRVVSGSASTTSRAPGVVAGIFGPLARKAVLQLGVGEIFLNSEENTRGAAATIDTTTAARLYRMEIDVETGAIAVLVDGVPTLTGSTFPEPSGATDRVFWGEGSLFAHGRTEWYSVRHDAYAGCAVD